MKTLMELETKIDRKETVRLMKKEMEQLYYFVNSTKNDVSSLCVEEGSGVSQLLPKVSRKDSREQRQFLYQSNRVAAELLAGMKMLPEKERVLLEELYLKKTEKDRVCEYFNITSATLRRRSQNALYHMAILLHKTVIKEF